MKSPLSYGKNGKDSAPVSVLNALSILLDESLPSSLIKDVYTVLLDKKGSEGDLETGSGALYHLSSLINENYGERVRASHLSGSTIFLGPGCALYETLLSGGVAVGRLGGKSVALTYMTNDRLYYFDPQYGSAITEGIGEDASNPFKWNRALKMSKLAEIERLWRDEGEKEKELLLLERV